jgi:hypothetical protein
MPQLSTYVIRGFLLALLAAAGCSGLTYIAPSTEVRSIDFTEYSRQGFMFTTEMYQGPYESIGIIYVTMHAEGKLETVNAVQRWIFSDLKVQDVIAEAHRKATGMGADAVVKLDIRANDKTVGLITVPGIEVSGFAIRRLGTGRVPVGAVPQP